MNKKSLMIGILSFFFFIILFLIKTDSIVNFDISIYNFLAMNMNDGLTNIFRSITFLGSGASIAGICIIALIITFHLKKRKIGLVIAACVTFNSLFSEGLKMIIQRPRPEILQLATESSFSFPSSHTLASVSLCGILLYFVLKWEGDKSLKIISSTMLVLLPILIGISRIYLGVHNASDVLGGAILAMILLLIEISIIEKNGYF